MEKSEADTLRGEIICLKERVEKLEAYTKALEKGFTRAIEAAHEFDKVLERYCDMIQDSNVDAFDRIKNIELKFFPNLATDLNQLDGIIKGDDNQKESPFERREPKK